MITIVIDNSYCQAVGMTGIEFSKLRALLSYEPDANTKFFGGYRGSNKKYLIDAKGFFPTGLLTTVLEFLISAKILVDVDDKRSIPTTKRQVKFNFQLKGILPYATQKAAIQALKDEPRGTISMPTGSGKSLVIAMLIAEKALRTLVVVPTLNIKNQLTESLHSHFGNTAHITVENIDSAKLKKASDYDMLVVDEGHHAAAKTYHKLNKGPWKNIYHRYFLTATPYRNVASEHLLLKAITGDIVYGLTYIEAVAAGQIVPVESFVVDVPTQNTEAYTYAEVYSQLVVNNGPRNEIIAGMLISLDAIEKATLCLVKEIKHGQILSALTGMPFVCGEDEESKDYIRQFNSGGIRCLIGTNGVLGEGVDTKPAEYVIIAGLGKARSAFQQQVGRGVRKFNDKESAKIILLRDKSHKFTLRHYREQAKILKEEYGTDVVKLEVE